MMAMSSVIQAEYGWSDLVHTLQCPKCSYQTLRPSAFRDHCRRTHPNLTDVFVYSCPTCRASSTDLGLIAEHKFLYHRSEPPNSSRIRQQCDPPPVTSSTTEYHTGRSGSISFSSDNRLPLREPSPASVQSHANSSRRQQSSREPSPVAHVVTRSRSSSSSSKARRSFQESSSFTPQPPLRSAPSRKRQASTPTDQMRRSCELSRPALPSSKKRQSLPSSTPNVRNPSNSTSSPRRSMRQKTPRRKGYSPDISVSVPDVAPPSGPRCSPELIKADLTSKWKKKRVKRNSSMKAIQKMTAAIISITAPDSPTSEVIEASPDRSRSRNECLTAEQEQQLAHSPVVRVCNIDASLLDETDDKVGSGSPQKESDKPSVYHTSSSSLSASAVNSSEGEASAKFMNVKPDSKLCTEVRSRMQHLYDCGVRGTSTMISNLREYVIKELRPPGPVGQKDRMYFPSPWTVRRLMRLMGSAENKNDLNKNASTPDLFPIKHRHIDIDTPLKTEPETFTVKTEETRLEMVRCLKCGVRVPFQSDGTRASQDAALIAHLSAKHGIKKREPIVYPSHQRLEGGHVTDLDAGYISSDDSPAKLASSDVRILKEKRVGPLAIPQVKQEWKEVKQQPEDSPDLQLTNVRLRGPRVIVKARHSGVDIDEQLTIPLSNEESKTKVEDGQKGEPRHEEAEMKVDVENRQHGLEISVDKEESIIEAREVENHRKITKELKENEEDLVETRVTAGIQSNEGKYEKLQEIEEGIIERCLTREVSVGKEDDEEKVMKALNDEMESKCEEIDKKIKTSGVEERLNVVENAESEEDVSFEEDNLNISTESDSIKINMKQAEVSLNGIHGDEIGTSADEAQPSTEKVTVDDRAGTDQLETEESLEKKTSRDSVGEGIVLSGVEVNSEDENEEEEGGNWQCDLCFAGFEDKEELMLHLQEIHNDF